jgi:hypothetical protein
MAEPPSIGFVWRRRQLSQPWPVLTSIGDAPMICGANASLLTGMVPMYALMSIFHAPPWLKLIANRRVIRDNKLKG